MAENFQETVSNPGGPGSLTVVYRKGDIIENTLGRVGRLVPNLLLGTPHSIVKRIPRESVQELVDRFKDVKWQGNVEVYLNHSPLFRQMKRLFSGDRRTHTFFRIAAGIPTTLYGWISAKTARNDFYNPFTESVTTYHSHPKNPVQMHEIGHAIDFDQSKEPTLRALSTALFPPFTFNLEWQASKNAMKHLAKGDERRTAQKVLEPAYGSYLGLLLSPINTLAYPAAILAGHIKSRIIPKNIFFNGEKISKTAL